MSGAAGFHFLRFSFSEKEKLESSLDLNPPLKKETQGK